jgi:hypothetical protein
MFIHLPHELITNCLYFLTDYRDLKNISKTSSLLSSVVAYVVRHTILDNLLKFIKKFDGIIISSYNARTIKINGINVVNVVNGICIFYSEQEPPIVVIMKKFSEFNVEFDLIKCRQFQDNKLLITLCSSQTNKNFNILFDGENLSKISISYKSLLHSERYMEYTMPILSSQISLFYDTHNYDENKYLLFVNKYSLFIKITSNCVIRLTGYKQVTQELLSFGFILYHFSKSTPNSHVFHYTCLMSPDDIKFRFDYTVDKGSEDIFFFTFADLKNDLVCFRKFSDVSPPELIIFKKTFDSSKSLWFNVKNSAPHKSYTKIIQIHNFDDDEMK